MSAVGSNTVSRQAIRAIALVEAFKGVLVLLVACGVLTLMRRQDLVEVAEQLVRHMHLNPASHYPHIFLDAVDNFQERGHLLWLAAGALGYSAARLAEGYGLWRERAWAEWLAALSGAIYLPFDVMHLTRHTTWLGVTVLLVNLAVVGVMVVALLQRRRAARARLQGSAPARTG